MVHLSTIKNPRSLGYLCKSQQQNSKNIFTNTPRLYYIVVYKLHKRYTICLDFTYTYDTRQNLKAKSIGPHSM